MYLYSCYDKVTKKFFPPFVCQSDEEAKRSFLFAAKSNPFKSDLQLYRLGKWVEDSKGTPLCYEDIADFICDYPNETEVE